MSKKPMQIDIVIIKKLRERKIHKKIGHIFRGHNLIEYKSPDDWLSANDFYKVWGYACFYISDTNGVLTIDPKDVTITFVCTHYPRKFLEHIKETLQIEAKEYAPGILHLTGGMLPMQLVLIDQLSPEESYWLQNLRNDLKSGGEIRQLIERYDAYKNIDLYQSVMNVILKSNKKEAEVERKMCDELKKLFAEDFAESEERGLQRGLKRGEKIGRAQGEKIGREQGELAGIQLAKDVFRLAAQGKTVDEIAGLCHISTNKVQEILH